VWIGDSMDDKDSNDHLVELIADGIMAALRRRKDHDDPEPLLHHFIDYLVLAVPEGTKLILCSGLGDGSQYLSNDPVFHFRAPDVSLKVKWCAPPIGQSLPFQLGIVAQDNPSCLETPTRNLDAVFKSLAGRDASSFGDLLSRVSEGISQLVARGSQRSNPGFQCKEELLHPGKVDDHLEELVTHVATGFQQAIRKMDPASALVMRYRGDDGWRWLLADRNKHTPGPDHSRGLTSVAPDQLAATVNSTVTGFVSLERLLNGRSLFCVPCHFGGVPWLLLCREVPAPPEGSQEAYVYYRDIAPTLIATIRVLAQHSFASEMLRLFKNPDGDAPTESTEACRAIENRWRALPRVFPVRRPRLVRHSELPREQAISLPVGGQDWYLSLTGENNEVNPYHTLYPALQSTAGEPWGAIEQEIVRSVFLSPAASDLRQEAVKRSVELAAGAYKIGHPLKDRVGPVRRAIGTIESDLRKGLKSEDVLPLVRAARDRLQRVEALGHVLDMISRAISAGEGRRTFLSKDPWRETNAPYDIPDRLKAMEVYANESETTRVHVTDESWEAVHGCQIRLWIDQEARAPDFFYDEIFTEIMINAARRGLADEKSRDVPLEIRFESIRDTHVGDSRTCLTFVNLARKRVDVSTLSLRLGEWNRWDLSRTGAVGGLFFLAMCLEKTESGCLYARVDRGEKHDSFQLAVWLTGLQKGMEESDGVIR
jgi:hypothetical protein